MAFDENHHHQAYVLRLQYLKELENLIEWIVILSASFTITTKQVSFKPTPALDTKSISRLLIVTSLSPSR